MSHLLTDVTRSLVPSRLRRASGLPTSVEQITPEWLTSVLPGRVTAVTVSGSDEGTTLRAHLELVGDDPIPRAVFVKLTPRSQPERALATAIRLCETEINAYTRLHRDVADVMPPVHLARWEPRTGASIVVIDDLVEAGYGFADVSTPCSPPEASAVAVALGRLHGRLRLPARGDLDLAPFAMSARRLAGVRGLTSLVLQHPRRGIADLIPEATRRRAGVLRARRAEIGRLMSGLPSAVQHGDTHRGNIAFAPDHAVVLVDWQVAGVGPLLKDLAYFAATSLEPDTRREHEKALVQQYLVSLGTAGGPTLDFSDAWRMYRALLFTAYEAAVVTAAFGSRLQSVENAANGVRRAVAAVEDQGTFECLDHLLDQRWVVASGR